MVECLLLLFCGGAVNLLNCGNFYFASTTTHNGVAVVAVVGVVAVVVVTVVVAAEHRCCSC